MTAFKDKVLEYLATRPSGSRPKDICKALCKSKKVSTGKVVTSKALSELLSAGAVQRVRQGARSIYTCTDYTAKAKDVALNMDKPKTPEQLLENTIAANNKVVMRAMLKPVGEGAYASMTILKTPTPDQASQPVNPMEKFEDWWQKRGPFAALKLFNVSLINSPEIEQTKAWFRCCYNCGFYAGAEK